MKEKGFAITGILYVLLIIFLASMTMLLFNLQNRKMILDQLKLDVVEAVESENNYEYLLNKISDLEAQAVSLNNVVTDLQKGMILSNLETVNETVKVPNDWQWHDIYTYTAKKDGLYLINGNVNFTNSHNSGGAAISVTSPTSKSSNDLVWQQFYDSILLDAAPISVTYYLKKDEQVSVRIAQRTSISSMPVQIVLEIQSSN